MRTQHDEGCTIYEPLDSRRQVGGVCTCGYGYECLRSGDDSQMYSSEFASKLIEVQDE